MKALKTLLLIVTVALMATLAPAQSGAGAAKNAKKAAAAATTELVDLNTASEKDLKALPGIGDVYAAKIVAGRPYANKSQLVSKNIIPEATYKKIQDKVIARKK